MERNHVFFSYSHKDEAFLRSFRVHLKPSEVQGSLDLWSDQDITPGQEWHEEIQRALASTAVAVLLVSPDFLASDYIRQHELPYLLQAREEGDIALICLYLRPSVVDSDDATTGVCLADGTTTRIKLTQYQGFNNPQEVVAALDENARDLLYVKAATALKKLAASDEHKPVSPPKGKRYELTVQLRLRGHQLTRIFLHHYGRFAEERSTWHWSGSADPGPALFETLFGTQAKCDAVLQRLFNADLARPIRYPVRVRVQTSEPLLAELPWSAMAWEGNVLRDHGWTFELMASHGVHHTPGVSQLDFPDTTLKAPCPVLLIAPSQAPNAEVHHRALHERLSHAWPTYHEPPPRVRDWPALVQAWQRRRPRIVYYYGPAENDGDTVTLLLDDPHGGIDRRPITALSQLWQTQPPQILIGNFVGSDVSLGAAMAAFSLPLIVTQTSPNDLEARRAFLTWLDTLLEGGEDIDPVWALHQHGLSTAVAWGAYGTWRTRTIQEPARDILPRLLLDRKMQRALGHDAVHELVRDGGRRLCCILAYGTAGNMAALFAEQLYEHLRRNAKEVVVIRRIPMRLPDAETFDVPKLAFEVRRYLGIRDGESFGTALARRKPRGPGRARPVLLLDWDVRGTSETNRLSFGALEAWLTFCCQQLGAQCPKDVRVMSCLVLEIAQENQATLEQAVRNLRAEAHFRDRAFHLAILPPLHDIEVSHLVDFLDGPGNSSCPDDLIPLMPELIINKTRGQFQATVDLIEQAERSSWYELYDELFTESSRPEGGTITKDILL